jgi:hypothetical protein
MAENVSTSMLFVDYLFDVYSNKDRVLLTQRDPFEEYDEGKFRERFRLSKGTVSLLLAEVSERVKIYRSMTNLAF